MLPLLGEYSISSVASCDVPGSRHPIRVAAMNLPFASTQLPARQTCSVPVFFAMTLIRTFDGSCVNANGPTTSDPEQGNMPSAILFESRGIAFVMDVPLLSPAPVALIGAADAAVPSVAEPDSDLSFDLQPTEKTMTKTKKEGFIDRTIARFRGSRQGFMCIFSRRRSQSPSYDHHANQKCQRSRWDQDHAKSRVSAVDP